MTFLGMSLITLMGKVKDLKTGMRNSQKDVIKKKKTPHGTVVCKEEFLTTFSLNLASCFRVTTSLVRAAVDGTEVILSGVSGMEILSHFPHPTK